MDEVQKQIHQHWEKSGDVEFIRSQLERRGIDLKSATIFDLANFDQLHSGLLESTEFFVSWIKIENQESVLDLGSGLGGTARYLAHQFDCSVTAVELSETLHQAGTELTRWVGLEAKVTHLNSDILGYKTDDQSEIIVLQHVDMHLPDKVEVYNRCRELLLSTGQSRIVWHDWLSGSGGELKLPVPWSREDENITFLSSEEDYKNNLMTAGLELHRYQTIESQTLNWFESTRKKLEKVLEKSQVNKRKRLESLHREVRTVMDNISEHRLVPFFAEARVKT